MPQASPLASVLVPPRHWQENLPVPPAGYTDAMGIAFLLAALAALIGAGSVIYRCVRVPKGPFPRCRGCGYALVGTPEAQRCPECGVDLAEDTTVSASSTAENLPSRETLWICVGAIAFAAYYVEVIMVERLWPWSVVHITGTDQFEVRLESWQKQGNMSRLVRQSAGRAIGISIDMEFYYGGRACKGTVTTSLILPDHQFRRVVVGADGGIVSQVGCDALTVGTKLDSAAMGSVYLSAGFDADTDKQMAAEADAVLTRVEEILDGSGGGTNLPAIKGSASDTTFFRTGGWSGSSFAGYFIPVGSTRVPLWPVMNALNIVAAIAAVAAIDRRRSRVVAALRAAGASQS